jgi:hypothetical protein
MTKTPGNANAKASAKENLMQTKSSIWMAIVLCLMTACGAARTPVHVTPTASQTEAENTIRFTYGNVSLITPPFLSNKITAEQRELREQSTPADDVPNYLQINIREPWDVTDESGLYSQVLVYPLADLVQTHPEAADAVSKLQEILNQPGESLPVELPFWPRTYYSGVIGAPLKSHGQPALYVHAERLDFASGHGVRYMTLLESQPARPTRFDGLIYTYQGLTSDGKYYVSVILPILISHEDAIQNDLEALARLPVPDWNGVAQGLSALGADPLYPSLADCDGLVRSLTVGP